MGLSRKVISYLAGMRRFFLVACFCLAGFFAAAQISISPSAINFFTVYEGTPQTINVSITNNTGIPLVVEDIDFYHGDAYFIQDTAFTVSPGGSHSFAVTCDPHQNVKYADWMQVKSSSHPFVPNAFTFAFVRYTDPYYDATQDKYNEDLKSALRTIITTGYTVLGYDDARDKLFMFIDNKALNGQGAAQNTLECVYTGTMAVGYSNRADAQTNFNMNTEHTIPQSLFGSQPPMYSDLHHLFVATASSNSERSNNPFGIVTNPTWQVGGSKSNGNIFEPRDQHKGVVARACFYFLTRHQDYSNFICNMESLMRTWHRQFAPDSIAIRRNDDVQFYQHNRNPFVDHPQFVDRIASFCSTNNGNPAPIAWWVADTLNFNSVANGSTYDGYFAIVNQGINPLNISNINVTGAEFSLLGSPLTAIPKDSLRLIHIRFSPSAGNQNFSGQLTFNTDDANAAAVTVHLMGNSFPVGIENSLFASQVKIWPNPAKEQVQLSWPLSQAENTAIELWDLTGRMISKLTMPVGSTEIGMDIAKLPAGCYLLKMQQGSSSFSQKLLKE
jgi:endonuclease I